MESLLPQDVFDRLRAMCPPHPQRETVSKPVKKIKERKPEVTKSNRTIECLECGKQIEATKRSDALFCSIRCRADFHKPAWVKNTKYKILDYKLKSKCARCGEEHPACLDFHHRDPKTKLFGISHAVSHHGYGWDRILSEIEKCDLLCANCHRIEHWKELIPQNIRTKETNVRKED